MADGAGGAAYHRAMATTHHSRKLDPVAVVQKAIAEGRLYVDPAGRVAVRDVSTLPPSVEVALRSRAGRRTAFAALGGAAEVPKPLLRRCRELAAVLEQIVHAKHASPELVGVLNKMVEVWLTLNREGASSPWTMVLEGIFARIDELRARLKDEKRGKQGEWHQLLRSAGHGAGPRTLLPEIMHILRASASDDVPVLSNTAELEAWLKDVKVALEGPYGRTLLSPWGAVRVFAYKAFGLRLQKERPRANKKSSRVRPIRRS